MSLRVSAVVGGLLIAIGAAAPSQASVAADASAKRAGAAKFRVVWMRAPSSARAGTRIRVRGRVANARSSRAARARLGLSLHTPRTRHSLRTVSVRRTRGGRSRAFAVRVAIPAVVHPRRYRLRVCVRAGRRRAHCRSRALRVLGRPATPAVPATPGTSPATPATPPASPPGPPADPELAAGRSLRAPVTDENFYFVMADRFENGDTANDRGGLTGDRMVHGYDPTHKGFYHGGDLKGLLQRIDYIRDLGTTSIWLTPSFKNRAVQPQDNSAGYHGYWITDFTQIDPHLGTNEDLRALVDAAHARGMKVYFDIITNHTADVIQYAEGARTAYVSKDQDPYRTAAGTPFDDRDHAGSATFPALDPAVSFPYTPFNPPGMETLKVPSWLNDVTLYHNRGDTTFAGEDALYGDFFGLDDLFTEHPRVVEGMIEIYTGWIRDFGIDGFRIDTMKHVNDEFWQAFAPRVLEFARDRGKSEFFMFGEVFDATKQFTSHFTTRDRVQAVLDFPFQAAAQDFAARSAPTDRLRSFFVGDDWYTDADSNAYQLPTFLGNHDMGRIGRFIKSASPDASDAELLARDRLAHELMYFSRGNPVIYYGDEQGFVGDGGDQDARQDMFPSQVGSYNDDDLIGTDATTAESNFDTDHPLFEAIAALAALTREHPALRDGVHQHRYSTGAAGVYAFSRYDRASGHEYVVALNNAEATSSAVVPTAAGRGAAFERIYGGGDAALETDSRQRLSLRVPALSAVVYRSKGKVPDSPAAPRITLAPLPDGGEARDRVEVQAFVSGDSFYDVTFYARAGGGAWQLVGTDDNAPYRVFHDVAGLDPGTEVEYRAVVLDNANHARSSSAAAVTVAEPAISMGAPAEGAKLRNRFAVTADVVPDKNHYTVEFFRRVADGAWTSIGTDSSQPAYTVFDDLTSLGLAPGTQVQYRAVLTYASGKTVSSDTRTAQVAPPPLTEAIVHYRRPAGDYGDWGLHLWGDAIADGVATDWGAPRQRDGVDAYGAFFRIPLKDDTKPVNFIVHRPSGDQVPDTREPGGDRSFIPSEHPEIWLKQGDPTVYFAPPPP